MEDQKMKTEKTFIKVSNLTPECKHFFEKYFNSVSQYSNQAL